MSEIKVCQATWQDDQDALKDIRNQVFIQEQNVAPELEWDEKDPQAQHFIAYIDGTAVACARLIEGKYIGRMAVLTPYRSLGLGKQLLNAIEQRVSNPAELELSAQCHAFMFYTSSGYYACSELYEDADIAHITMKYSGNTEKQTKYVFGQDSVYYKSSDPLINKGYLDLLLSQSQRSISICLKDLHHPLCSDPYLIERIKKMASQQRYFNVHILLNFYHPSYSDHPLFRLQSLLPNSVEIKQTDETIPCQWVFDGTARFDYEQNNSRTCFSDPLKTRPFMERFNKWWHTSKPIQRTKRLYI